MSGAMQDTLPDLPQIAGDVDLMLDVYTHPTLRQTNAPMNEDYGDTNRLAELGAKVLDLTVTYHFYSERPFLNTDAIRERKQAILGDENIDQWLRSYNLKSKLRISPNDQHILEDPEQMRKYFNTYIGALYIRNGLPAIQEWISKLIDPSVEAKLPGANPPSGKQSPAPNQMDYQIYQNQGYASPAHSQYSTSSFGTPQASFGSTYAPPPSFAPPPLPSSPPTTMSPNMSLVTLALVNQTAAQRGYQVTYPAEQAGPSHQPTWTVRCCLNGNQCGIGYGKSQKIAKEEAARQAWVTMGWGPS